MRSRAGSSPRGTRSPRTTPLVEIQTDKTTVEIPSPAAGHVSQHPRRRRRGRPGRDGARRDRRRERPPPRRPVCTSRDGPESSRPGASRRRRSYGGSPASSASTSRPSRRPGPAAASPRHDVRAAAATQVAVCHKLPEGRREKVRGRPPPDRRAPDARAPRGPGRHVRRGVRLHDVDLQLLLPIVLRGDGAVAARVPGAERAARGRRDRLPRPLRPRRRRADRPGARRPGRPRLRHAHRRASCATTSTRSPRRRARGTLDARGAARLDVHRDERRQARAASS